MNRCQGEIRRRASDKRGRKREVWGGGEVDDRIHCRPRIRGGGGLVQAKQSKRLLHPNRATLQGSGGGRRNDVSQQTSAPPPIPSDLLEVCDGQAGRLAPILHAWQKFTAQCLFIEAAVDAVPQNPAPRALAESAARPSASGKGRIFQLTTRFVRGPFLVHAAMDTLNAHRFTAKTRGGAALLFSRLSASHRRVSGPRATASVRLRPGCFACRGLVVFDGERR